MCKQYPSKVFGKKLKEINFCNRVYRSIVEPVPLYMYFFYMWPMRDGWASEMHRAVLLFGPCCNSTDLCTDHPGSLTARV